MSCPFCEWEMGYGGTVDPCEVVCAFDEHLLDHVTEMVLE